MNHKATKDTKDYSCARSAQYPFFVSFVPLW